MGKKDNKPNLKKAETKSEKIYVTQEEFDKVNQIGAEIMSTEKAITQIAVKQKQFIDRIIFLEGQRIALQSELYKKYGIAEGESCTIQQDLELVINN